MIPNYLTRQLINQLDNLLTMRPMHVTSLLRNQGSSWALEKNALRMSISCFESEYHFVTTNKCHLSLKDNCAKELLGPFLWTPHCLNKESIALQGNDGVWLPPGYAALVGVLLSYLLTCSMLVDKIGSVEMEIEMLDLFLMINVAFLKGWLLIWF